MAGAAGVDGDDILKKLYDLDEDRHSYHIIKRFKNEKDFEVFKRRYRKDRAERLFASGQRKTVFRTVKRGGRVYRIAMQKKMNWHPKGGNLHHHRSVKPFFDNKPIDGKS